MAKVVIVFEDLADGRVKIQSDPSMEVLMKALDSKKDVSPAEGYAYHALMTVWQAAKSKDPLRLKLPKVGA